MLNPVFDQFVKKSPISVMARGMMERVLDPQQLDEWFETTADQQYTRELLFSTVFDIMSQVVRGSHPSVHATYQAKKEDIGVSITSVYNKLNGIEPNISANLVRYAAGQVEPLIKGLGGTVPSPLPGLRIRILDGNCIKKTEHRIKELRSIAAGPLPGKSLVVYDPVLRLPVDVFPCEDGHAQERSLLKKVLLSIKPDDVWIADRNFCTVEFTCEIDSQVAFFVIREHKNYPCKILEKQKYIGKVETGKVYEQLVSVIDDSGQEHIFRRIRVALNKKTRNGDTDIYIISNLSKSVANAKKIAELYRDRWTIETAFQYLEDHYNSEINTLGYPRAALFAFCVALVCYIIVSVMKSALGSVHGVDVIEKQVSGYYIADEISGTYRGMMIAIDDAHWVVFRHMPAVKLLKLLKELAGNIKLSAFRKHPRGPKKPQPKRKSCKNTPHVSTAKILANRSR
jgi:IS4 transposase